MITGYQISIEEGRVHLYVTAGYDQLRKIWNINSYINFVGGECSELLPIECYGLPAFEIDLGIDEKYIGTPHFVHQMAKIYAKNVDKQIGDGPLPVPTLGEKE